MTLKLKNWLLIKIAGKSTVLINARFDSKNRLDYGNPHGTIISNVKIDEKKVEPDKNLW